MSLSSVEDSVRVLSKSYNVPEKVCLDFYFSMFKFLEDNAVQVYDSDEFISVESFRLTENWVKNYSLNNR